MQGHCTPSRQVRIPPLTPAMHPTPILRTFQANRNTRREQASPARIDLVHAPSPQRTLIMTLQQVLRHVPQRTLLQARRRRRARGRARARHPRHAHLCAVQEWRKGRRGRWRQPQGARGRHSAALVNVRRLRACVHETSDDSVEWTMAG